MDLVGPLIYMAIKQLTDRAAANIEYGSPDDYARAQQIAHAFEQAGWQYRLGPAAPEYPGPPHQAGVEVYGTDGHIVNGVAHALNSAQVPDVRSWVIENPSQDHPWTGAPIYIYVGHERSPAGRLSSWTTPSVLVGIAAVVVTYVVAAAPLHWWPF